MTTVLRHGRIPGQMLEATSPMSAARYMELERKLEQEKELDSRAKKILRALIKAIGGIGAVSVSVLGIGTIINSLKRVEEVVKGAEEEAKDTAETLKGIPKESEDIINVSKYLGMQPVEVYQKLDRRYNRQWLEGLLKQKKASVGYEFIPVQRKDKGKFGLLRMAFKKHFGGFIISYDPTYDMLRIGPRGVKVPTPMSRTIHNLAASIIDIKKFAEQAFSRNPGLKNTPVYKSYTEAVGEVDKVLSKKHHVDAMNPKTLTIFALELAHVRDILNKTIKDDTALMNLFTTVEKEMKEKSLHRQHIISKWGLEIPSDPDDIKKDKPSNIRDRMEQLHVLLGKPEFFDSEAKMIMGKLETDIKTIAPIEKQGPSYKLPRFDQKLIPRYASDISHAQSFIKRKLIQAGTIEEAASRMDLSMMKSIAGSLQYRGNVVMF